jgi:hypothetical protein
MKTGVWLRVAGAAVKVRGMRKPLARATAVLALLVVLGPRDGGSDGRVIQYDKDTLTVRLTKVPVAEILDELGRQSGAQIRGQVRTPRDVTAEFDAVPLPEALHRLLGDQNFALIYGDGGRLAAVRLLGGPQGSPGQPPPAAATVTPAPQAAATNLAALVARHDPVPVSGQLAQVVGGMSATFQQLFDVVLHNEDATVRGEGVRAVVSALEADPALRAAVVGELSNVEDTTLGSLLRGAAGEHAEEIAMQIMTQARASEIRVKASAVLQKLRTGS